MWWWFESTQRDQRPCSPIRQRQQVESLFSGGSSPPVVTIGSWRNRQTRHVQTVQVGVRIPASRPIPVWRNGVRSRPKPDSPASGAGPCGFESHRWDHPEGDIVEGKDAALSAREHGFESRCPRQDGAVSCGGKGRRPWRSHEPRNAGSIPASATMGFDSSPATRPAVGEGKRCAARL